MSESEHPTGQVESTPEGGPIDVGTPAQEPGAGQVQATPEASPLSDQELKPPTWREHMDGPIPGLDDAAARPSSGAAPAAAREEASSRGAGAAGSARETEGELRKWPPYSGKPVSEVNWQEIGRYAAPVAAQAEKLVIQAVDLSARGLSRLARYLETRREERSGSDSEPRR
jgi:hypothetical protein